jgi:hypothetical protein
MMKQELGFPGEIVIAGMMIDEWRKTRLKKGRMPPALWEAAVRAAKAHGVYKTSRALGLSYSDLKRRAEGGSNGRVSVEPEFFEMGRGSVEGVFGSKVAEVEICEVDGSRLRIRLSGVGGIDAARLVESFRGRGRCFR